VNTIRRLALDTVLWYCLPAAFLATYVGVYSKPSTAISPHVFVITLPLLALFIIRILLSRLITDSRLRRLTVAFLTATLLGLLLTYYCLVVIGLRAWGGVVAWDVIPVFFAQAEVIADSVGIPLFLFALAALLAYIGLAWACWLYFGRFDSMASAIPRISRPTVVTVVVGLTAILALGAYQLSLGQWTIDWEPVSLTMFPRSGALDLEGYSVNPVSASRLDKLEDAARHEYVPTGAHGRNLVLIVVDALRPDHMGIYGYGRDTTPHLAHLIDATHARIIAGTHSSCADTACGLYSLFSSKFPNDFSFRPMTLHEALRLNGYRIHMVLSGDQTYFYGLKGFYGQVDSFYDGTQAHGYFLNDDQLVVDHLAAMPDWDGKPVMFQFHLMSAHILRKNDATPGPFQPAKRYALHNSRETVASGDPPATAINFYDNGVLHADSIINDLLQTLGAKGYLKNTLVVLTADHGESLGEHGLFTHANSVREEVLRIPLVLIPYGYEFPAGSSARALPSQVDIAPTILSELTLPLPTTWIGRQVDSPTGQEFSYFEEHSFAGLIDHRDPAHAWKYWIDRRTGTDHVFDLSADPQENVDLRGTMQPDLLRELRTRAHQGTSAGLEIR
jgi:glucan phosphoethanolaminetransferase (alkaline phosphatase superfamily)